MTYILNIHTATETAIVSLVANGTTAASVTNTVQKLHASFLHNGVKDVLQQQKVSLKDVDAIGVSIGPGSYTGIRIGLAAAKGLCYALKIPLVTYTSLQLLALSAIEEHKDAEALYCPVIDARRMEVYASVYTCNMKELLAPSALIIDQWAFANLLTTNKIYFTGDGIGKLENIIDNDNAVFLHSKISEEAIANISMQKFINKEFEALGNAEPLYIKDFHSS